MTLAPALQRSLQFLQMNSLEFAQEIHEALERNPLLETEDDSDPLMDMTTGDVPEGLAAEGVSAQSSSQSADSIGDESGPLLHDEAASDGSVDARDEGGDGLYEVEHHAESSDADATPHEDDSFRDAPTEQDWSTSTRNNDGDGTLSALDRVASQVSLRDHLIEQLLGIDLPARARALTLMIVDSLDAAGYLRESADELLDMANGLPDDIVGKDLVVDEEIEQAIGRVHQLDPIGVGARSVEECLALQLHAMPVERAGRTLAMAIVNEHLGLLAQGDFRGLATQTGADQDALSDATRLIRSLAPKPGLPYVADRVEYAIPEVVVRKVGPVWVARLHSNATPRLRINKLCADVIARNVEGSAKTLQSQLQEAKWLLRSIDQRASTIEKTAQAIVARQQRFFEYGDIGLQPMRLADVASDIGIHESTVSRVVSSKYLQCPRGLIPMKRFFTSHVATAAGDACSATAVKAMIRQLIDAESPQKPLSDHRLAKMLGMRGINIARRTVTKYRDALGIDAVDMRKHMQSARTENAATTDAPAPKSSATKRATRAAGESREALAAATARRPAASLGDTLDSGRTQDSARTLGMSTQLDDDQDGGFDDSDMADAARSSAARFTVAPRKPAPRKAQTGPRTVRT